MCLESSTTNFGKKTYVKLAYSLETFVETSSAFKWAIQVFFEGYISSPKSIPKAATYIIKASCFELRVAAANSFFPFSSTCPVVRSIS